MQVEQMPMVRVFFSKTGRAKYTSHLDLMRTFSRAFKRSGLPVWYTQGFNPHIYMNFALPIALGYESETESLDIRLTGPVPYDEVVEKLNRTLPPGFKALKAAAPVSDPGAITWADYDIGLVYENESAEEIKSRLEAFLRLPVIEVSKKTKKGEKTVDIKPLSRVLSAETGGDRLHMKLRMASGNKLNINPTIFLKAFYEWSNTTPEGVKIKRTAVLDDQFSEYA